MYQVHSPTSDTDGFAMAVNNNIKLLCAQQATSQDVVGMQCHLVQVLLQKFSSVGKHI